MKFDRIIMWILTGLAAIVCVMIIINFNPWIFVLAYWIVTLIRNLLIIKEQKECKEEEIA